MASRTLQTRYSLVTFCMSPLDHLLHLLTILVNSTTQWTKAETAIKPWLAGVVITSEDSVCAHTIRQKNKIFLVEDLSKDPRFCDKKYVTHYPYMRFYAGVPLKLKTSPVPIGALCVNTFLKSGCAWLTSCKRSSIQSFGASRQVKSKVCKFWLKCCVPNSIGCITSTAGVKILTRRSLCPVHRCS